MNGNRKFIVVLLYMVAVTFIAFSVVFWKTDSLIGAGAWATGMATGIGAFMWGNAKEHQAKSKE